MKTKQVEFTEAVSHDGRRYEEGDRVSVSVSDADYFISLGWAKCAKTGEQGERKPGASSLTVQPVVQKVK